MLTSPDIKLIANQDPGGYGSALGSCSSGTRDDRTLCLCLHQKLSTYHDVTPCGEKSSSLNVSSEQVWSGSMPFAWAILSDFGLALRFKFLFPVICIHSSRLSSRGRVHGEETSSYFWACGRVAVSLVCLFLWRLACCPNHRLCRDVIDGCYLLSASFIAVINLFRHVAFSGGYMCCVRCYPGDLIRHGCVFQVVAQVGAYVFAGCVAWVPVWCCVGGDFYCWIGETVFLAWQPDAYFSSGCVRSAWSVFWLINAVTPFSRCPSLVGT